MTEEKPAGCARPAAGLVGEARTEEAEKKETQEQKGEEKMITVGQKAPDFSAPAYHNGEFTTVALSDFLGKWVSLCFYPGDFTFV